MKAIQTRQVLTNFSVQVAFPLFDCQLKISMERKLCDIYIYIIIYNLHGLSCQEKVSRFSMLLIPRNGTSVVVSHWKLRMVLMVEYRSSRLDQNKPFSGPVSTLLSSSAELYSLSLSGRLAPLDELH